MGHHEKSPRRRHTKGNQTPFTDRIIRVVTGHRERIEERARSFLERDTVFSEVLTGLSGIPLTRRISLSYTRGAGHKKYFAYNVQSTFKSNDSISLDGFRPSGTGEHRLSPEMPKRSAVTPE